ncbi:hypothetical protein OCB72_29635 [Bacillus cereus]|nr:hypothetical protein [Bacillus cereus]
MESITITEVWNIVSNKRYSSLHYAKIADLIENLECSGILKQIDEKHLFYPKKVFRERGDAELLFFSKDIITVSKINSFGNLTIRSFPIKDINRLELLNLSVDNSNVELVVYLLNERPIKLSNVKDTNIILSTKFYNLILDIYAMLTS